MVWRREGIVLKTSIEKTKTYVKSLLVIAWDTRGDHKEPNKL